MYSGTRSGLSLSQRLSKLRIRPGVLFAGIIFAALIAFEIFNYSTTDYALGDLLGELEFAGMRWSTVLALAFCGIDFAGIARIFTPEQGAAEPKEVWYLMGAWMLAATMNAALTWWGVSRAIANHAVKSTAVVDAETLTSIVPVFVAIMVWVIRVLIIGSLSLAVDRLTNGARAGVHNSPRPRPLGTPAVSPQPAGLRSPGSVAPRPTVARPAMSAQPDAAPMVRPEPTYHSMSASSRAGQRPAPAPDTSRRL
jgi:hypothetical protein